VRQAVMQWASVEQEMNYVERVDEMTRLKEQEAPDVLPTDHPKHGPKLGSKPGRGQQQQQQHLQSACYGGGRGGRRDGGGGSGGVACVAQDQTSSPLHTPLLLREEQEQGQEQTIGAYSRNKNKSNLNRESGNGGAGVVGDSSGGGGSGSHTYDNDPPGTLRLCGLTVQYGSTSSSNQQQQQQQQEEEEGGIPVVATATAGATAASAAAAPTPPLPPTVALKPALRRLTLTVQAGQKVGVVGRTGAGKSTLASALFRLLEPVEGCVLLGGHNTSKLGLKTLRKRLALIPQEPALFDGTVGGRVNGFDGWMDGWVVSVGG
jgi:ABC-type multidrug transport system fused ATPase/permease subunit